MSDRTRVFNCDCLPAMKEFPDKWFDLAIVDPPYGLGDKLTNGGTWAKDLKTSDSLWDIAPSKEYFEELFRVSKHQIIWGANYFDMPPNRGFIIWDKKLTDNWTLAMAEYAYCSIDTTSKIFRCSLSEGVQKEGDRIHLTQKPVKLYKWLLKNYAKEGDKILDSHGGSMSSVIACLDMGFSITCYELDPDYYNAGKNRIINHLKQLNAFRPAYDIEFHDNSGVSELRNNAGIGYQEQNNGQDKEPIHRIDGLFHGDPS